MKRIALLLAGLALGTQSPAMADSWAPRGPVWTAATSAVQLAQNNDPRDRRNGGNARDSRGERPDPREQRRAPDPRTTREMPQRDPRATFGSGDPRQAETRQVQERDPRANPERREPVREPQPQAPQARPAPRFSEQSARGAIARQYPGGRVLNSNSVMRGGQAFYSVRVQTRDGQLVDFLFDAATGAISRGGG